MDFHMGPTLETLFVRITEKNIIILGESSVCEET